MLASFSVFYLAASYWNKENTSDDLKIISSLFLSIWLW